jgi:hypothetical protein
VSELLVDTCFRRTIISYSQCVGGNGVYTPAVIPKGVTHSINHRRENILKIICFINKIEALHCNKTWLYQAAKFRGGTCTNYFKTTTRGSRPTGRCHFVTIQLTPRPHSSSVKKPVHLRAPFGKIIQMILTAWFTEAIPQSLRISSPGWGIDFPGTQLMRNIPSTLAKR